MATRLSIAAMLTVCLATGSAWADTTVLARSGAWEAFGGTTNNGTLVCGISTSPEDKYFGLKLFAGDDTFSIQISDKDWDITDKNKYGVTMRLDGNRPWRATATGMHFNDGDPGLEYTIRKQELNNFNREFAESSRLRLQFANGMSDWVLNLSGAHNVNAEFKKCVAKIK